MHCNKLRRYSITSLASDRRSSEILMPSAFAVLRLITNSNLVTCVTGRSAGFFTLKNPAGVDARQTVGLNRGAVAVCVVLLNVGELQTHVARCGDDDNAPETR